jgi:integrase
VGKVEGNTQADNVVMRELNSLQVQRTNEPGRYRCGDNLWLQVTPTKSGKGVSKSWLLRYTFNDQERQMGLGSLRLFTLKEARERARKFRQMLADGIDPIEAKHQRRAKAKAERAKHKTFKQCAEAYIAAHGKSWKNEKHAAQWPATLATYAYPVMGDLPVASIDVPHVLQAIEPIWAEKPETASRVRQRIEAVLDWATARKYRHGPNPAAWKGHLDKLLPKAAKLKRVKHHAALPWADVPAFMAELRSRDSISTRALEYLILTATRTGEVIGARWNEIDFATKAWTIPATRMKAGKEHRVPLSDRALEILEGLPREGEFVFPGGKAGQPLSNMAMLELMKGMKPGYVPHGFRSTFRDWAAERTNFPRWVCEVALAHVVQGVEGDYRRGDLFEKRRQLMRAWAEYCASRPASASGKVVAIGVAVGA